MCFSGKSDTFSQAINRCTQFPRAGKRHPVSMPPGQKKKLTFMHTTRSRSRSNLCAYCPCLQPFCLRPVAYGPFILSFTCNNETKLQSHIAGGCCTPASGYFDRKWENLIYFPPQPVRTAVPQLACKSQPSIRYRCTREVEKETGW